MVAFFKVTIHLLDTYRSPGPQDKDTSKFDMALKQTLDSIKARAAWVKVCINLAMLHYLTDTLDVAFHFGVDSMVGQAQFEALVTFIS